MNGDPCRRERRWPYLVIGILLLIPMAIPPAIWGPRMIVEVFAGTLSGDPATPLLLLAWILILPAAGIGLLLRGCRRRRT